MTFRLPMMPSSTILEVIPSLQYSCFRRNLSYIPTSIPPSTQHLDFSFNYLTTLQRHMFPRLPLLQHLDLTRCHIQNIDNGAFFNVRNLSVLVLTGNPLKYFGRSSINVLEKIHKLVLVEIGLLSLDSLNLQNLTSLKELKLGTNRILCVALPTYSVTFKGFTLLDLHRNNISVIRADDTSVLRQMGSNVTLILSRNPISFIETGAFAGLYFKEINLFDTFISSTVVRDITGGLSGLNVIRLKIGNFEESTWQETVGLLLDYICYQFYIHYCFILLRGYRMSRQQECSYDAFVIYSSKDETWVLDELVENLEKGHPPIQLCLHERDFQAGKSITSNIVDEGIMGSRKVIVVVSQHFLNSSWCQFEFELAQSWLVLRRNASIIIIILEDVEDKKIKRLFRLHKYLKKNTYLKWKGNALSNIRFWARLRKAIIAKN
ncbi:toll-like receptor 4 [Alosa alosa]|uniref:toll-like receptor 4 n=1 Tax=Alosa alosa TaxID=278164 RepID=UPI002015194C|nr:toll-like receptor 4 [Alosa alosa]